MSKEQNLTISKTIKSYNSKTKLESAYAEMAQDKEREKEALEWIEYLLQDFS